MSATQDVTGLIKGTELPEVTSPSQYDILTSTPFSNVSSFGTSLLEGLLQSTLRYFGDDENMSGADDVNESTIFPNTSSNGTAVLLYNHIFSADYNNPDGIDVSEQLYPGEYKNVALWEIIIKIITYIPIIVLAFIGNLFVTLVVAKNKRMRTTTNYYIVNLAIADLLFVVSCSWVHLLTDLTEGWILGAFFCRFNTFAQVLSLIASIFTLTFIACDRFFGIVFSMKAHFIERQARYTIIALWFCSVAVATPLLIYRKLFEIHWKDHVEQWCGDNWPVVLETDAVTNSTIVVIPAQKIYYTFICVVLFFLPTLLMTAAYAVIIWTLWSTQVPGERLSKDIRVQTKLRKKTIVMLVLILFSFVVCWCPTVIILLYDVYRKNRDSSLGDWFKKLEYFARYLSQANSAINPIIYAGFNDNFKKGFQNLFPNFEKKSRYNTMVSRVDSFQSSTDVTKV